MFVSNPFQRLTPGGTFSRTFQVFAFEPKVFLVLSTIIHIPLLFMMITTFHFLGSSVNTLNAIIAAGGRRLEDYAYSNSNANDYNNYYNEKNAATVSGDDFTKSMITFLGQFALEYVVLLFVAVAGRAAMAHAVAVLYVGSTQPQWHLCFQKGVSRWCDIFGATMLVSAGTVVCSVLLQLLFLFMGSDNGFVIFLFFVISMAWMVALVYVMVCIMILVPVIMVEGTGPINSLKRCWELASNNRCYIFCTAFCLGLMYYVVQLCLSAILLGGADADAMYTTWGAIVMTIPAILYIPLQAIMENVVYINIRVQQEGLNADVLENELKGHMSDNDESKYALVKESNQQIV